MEQAFNSIEKVNAELNQKIAFAKVHAINSELLTKNPPLEEDMDMIRNARIVCKTLYELKTALNLLGIKSEDAEFTLAHENAHANKAESIDAVHKGYYILVGKVDGEYAYKVSTDINLPDEWDFIKKKESLIKILKAPEEYGDELSPSDLSTLRKLEG